MTLMQITFRKPRLLKLAIDVAGKNPMPQRHNGCPLRKNRKTPMRHRTAIKPQPMPIKAPGQTRMLDKSQRIRHFGEVHPRLRQRRIRLPKTLIAAKVRQTQSTPLPAPAAIIKASAFWISFAARSWDSCMVEFFISKVLQFIN